MSALQTHKKIRCTVFAPDFNIVFNDFLSGFDATQHQTLIYLDDRITNTEQIITLTEKIENIELLSGKINIWYESGAHIELTR